MKEAQTIEWKQSWRDEYPRWFCGFANAEGGTLVIGKNDSVEVVGVANAAKLLEGIPNKVRDILGIVMADKLHTQSGRDWLEVLVDACPSPIGYKGEYHLRSGSTKQELRGAALDRFLLSKLGRHWGGVPLPHVAMTDLEPGAIQTFRTLAKSGRLATTVRTPVAILRCLAANTNMTLVEVAATISKTPRAIEQASAKLVREGKLKFVGPKKSGHWEVLEKTV